MRIARLELHGFKSFADRTVFHFGAGISCVVGPNGCGKSNVVDALKWVIGEMSAKSLRGEDMLDVIFAGSAERKPVGYAEVALTLGADPEDPFPGDFARYAEVQLARRLYRDGTSEYLVNQARAEEGHRRLPDGFRRGQPALLVHRAGPDRQDRVRVS